MLLTRVANFKKAIVRLFLMVAVAMTLFLAAAPSARAATITVNSTIQVVNPGASGNGDGLCQLSEAIRAANTDLAVDGCAAGSGADVIFIPAGTYTLSSVDNTTNGANGLPVVTSPITFQGAGALVTIIERSTAVGTPDFRLLFVALSSSPGSVILNDLTFRNGRSTLAFQAQGGAIRNGSTSGTDLSVNRCVFDNNTVFNLTDNNSSGGAISGGNIPLAVLDSEFKNNSASSGGGAIDLFTSVTGSTFINNTASAGNINGSGGALRGSSVTVSNSTFVNNSVNGSTGFGGGAIMVLSGGTSTITRNVFTGNSQNSTNGVGGAVFLFGTVQVTISENLFLNNTSVSTAGAIYGPFANAVISGNTFQGNRSAGNGGAIWAGTPTIISNSTFSGNTAGTPGTQTTISGGAIVSVGGLTLNNVTVTGNTAANVGIGGQGGGILFGNNDVIRNSIVAGNSGFAPDCFVVSGFTVTSQGHNIIGVDCGLTAGTGDQIGTAGTPITPLLSGLANNGTTVMAGTNQFGQTPVAIQTHALLTGSPALGGGDPGTPDGVSPHCAGTDQRGFNRPQPAGGVCDVGAFEDPTGLGVAPSADLSVTKTGTPGSVTAGQNVTFTITVTNNGPDSAPVTLDDVLPASFNFVSFAPPGGWNTTTPAVGATGTVHSTKTALASGASAVFTLVVTATSNGSIGNTATVSSTANDPDNTNNSATATTTVSGGTDADLSLTKSGPASFALGSGDITYTLVVSNAGPLDATNVVLTDTLPAGVTFVSVTPTGPVCTQAVGVVTCNLGGMVSGGSATITIVVTPTATGSLTNSASVTATETDPVPGNNTATASTTVSTSADLAVTKTASPNPVSVNANLTYTITVTNNGPATATSASLSDALPAGVNFVSLTPPAGWTCTTPAVGANGTVSCTNPSLASAASAVFTLVVTPTAAAAASISNTATISSATTDPNTADNSQTATTTVTPIADLSITKTGTPNPVAVNSNITYTITVTNNGPSAATSVSVSDTVPANVTFVSATGGGTVTCSQAGGVITCSVGTLASGASASGTVVLRTTALGTVTNTATVSSSTTDPNAANNSTTSTNTVSVQPATDFSLTLVPLSREVRPGGTATYTATLTPSPANTSFNTAIGLSCFTTLIGANCAASPGSVTPGATPATSTITVTVPQGSVAPFSPQPPVFRPWLWMLGLVLTAYSVWELRRRQRWMLRRISLAAALFALALGQSACSGALQPPIAPYVLTVTATSGSLSHSVTATVNVVK